MCLPPTHTWTKKEQAHQHRVRSRWGSEGRLNLMGTLRVQGEGHEQLEYQVLEGSCDSREVMGYLDIARPSSKRAPASSKSPRSARAYPMFSSTALTRSLSPSFLPNSRDSSHNASARSKSSR